MSSVFWNILNVAHIQNKYILPVRQYFQYHHGSSQGRACSGIILDRWDHHRCKNLSGIFQTWMSQKGQHSIFLVPDVLGFFSVSNSNTITTRMRPKEFADCQKIKTVYFNGYKYKLCFKKFLKDNFKNKKQKTKTMRPKNWQRRISKWRQGSPQKGWK